MTAERLTMFFSGFCAVSGSIINPNDYNRYRLTLPKVGGGYSTGYMHYCCWPCVCDTQDFIRVDTKNVTTSDGVSRALEFAVIGNPCDHPEKLHEPFMDVSAGWSLTLAVAWLSLMPIDFRCRSSTSTRPRSPRQHRKCAVSQVACLTGRRCPTTGT